MAVGRVVQIIGPVIDCEFDKGDIPRINEAVKIVIDPTLMNEDGQVTDPAAVCVAEVLQQRGGGVVRCVSFNPTEGLMRGLPAISTGSSVKVPVGEKIAGRLFDALGNPIDEAGPLSAEDYWPIHRKAPSYVEQYPTESMLETGIKVIDLLVPFSRGDNQGRRC